MALGSTPEIACSEPRGRKEKGEIDFLKESDVPAENIHLRNCSMQIKPESGSLSILRCGGLRERTQSPTMSTW